MADLADVISLAEAQEHLAAWLNADTLVSKGQAVSAFGRSYTAADAQTITDKIKFWKQYIVDLKDEASNGAGIQMMGGLLGPV